MRSSGDLDVVPHSLQTMTNANTERFATKEGAGREEAAPKEGQNFLQNSPLVDHRQEEEPKMTETFG